jgi:hypothetical protein
MSASSIADGLVTMLSAASVFGTGMVSKNSYQVLESSSGSCAVVQWTGLTSQRTTYGGAGANRNRTWNFQIRCFIRDTGQAPEMINHVWTATDLVLSTLESDETILGTADELGDINGSRDPETVFTVGGATWLPFTITAQILEWTP